MQHVPVSGLKPDPKTGPMDQASRFSREDIVEWLGSLLGVAGALLLASKSEWSPYGWPLFLGSNVCWIGYAVLKRVKGLFVMQLIFTATSVLGIARWMT